ncbi:molybdenum cofactor biosynthesis protein B [Halobacillus sp. KGW1]|uniref:MogA/MoaB family molybdenum cofactor biosynthesis protein n=1 Tax=Halobacillus sp. KGW1 TaxID=1793726 RepID=UPI000780D122|nr:MogA/MoaB family molybdenum cofactor biosynthesis protein [Halobacillus sp. KGW1]
MAVHDHRRKTEESIRCLVLTVSDTRDERTDKSGKLIMKGLEEAGHVTSDYGIVKDEKGAIASWIHKGVEEASVDVILLNGGTGIAGRDVTVEVVDGLLDKGMPGFGEIFRMLSFTDDIGSAAILSRATAGVIKRTAVFAMPGSTGAVKLAMERLILPELNHVVNELKKDT